MIHTLHVQARKLIRAAAALSAPSSGSAAAEEEDEEIDSVEGMERAARRIKRVTGCGAVLLKGGHLGEGGGAAADDRGRAAVDVLFDGERTWRLELPWVETGNTHGTGCTLASSVSAGLAKGLSLIDAVREGKRYVQGALEASAAMDVGTGVQKPFNHGFMLADWTPASAKAGPASAAAAPDERRPSSGLPLRASDGRVNRDAVRKAMRLYAVTDPGCNARAGRTMEEAVRLAVYGGATMVQIREKDVDGGSFLGSARAAYEARRSPLVPQISFSHMHDLHIACCYTSTGVSAGLPLGQCPADHQRPR